ncbi:hypothetical protein [Promicromonospora soli]
MSDTPTSIKTPTPAEAGAAGAGAPPAAPSGRRRRRLIVAGVAAAAVVAGTLGTVTVLSAVAAEPAAATSEPAAAAYAPGRLPIGAELREDIRELVRADPEDRPELRQAIRERAEAGEYGPRARIAAERIDERLEELPAELKADLADLQAAPVEDRPELRREIREQAEAGEYGAGVQARVEELQQAFDAGGLRALAAEIVRGA